jgi:hypothetical protein
MESAVGKSLSISSFRTLPVAVIGSILLFLVTQALIADTQAFWRFCYFYSDPLPDDGIRLEAQLRGIVPSDGRKKIFLAGSSQTREDFDVDSLNQNLKETQTIFYNFGISGNASPIEMFMLKDRLLAKNPAAVIYVPFIGTFYSRYYFEKMKYYFSPVIIPHLLKALGLTQIVKSENIRTSLIESVLGTLTVFYRYRESLRRIIFTALSHHLHIARRAGPKHYAYAKSKPPAYFAREIKRAQGNKYSVSGYTAFSEYLFVRFAQDIIAGGVKLVVISGPVHPLITKCYPEEIDLRYHSFLSRQAEKLGFAYLPQSHLPRFAEQDFIDFTHLNESGRKKLTRFLEDYVSKAILPLPNAAPGETPWH